MYRVIEHEYLAKGLTETALTTLWVILNKHSLQWTHMEYRKSWSCYKGWEVC